MNNEKTLVYIPIDRLIHHPDNPRKDLGDLTELTDSIRKNGVLQNLTVVPAEEAGQYYVVIGNRRMEASKAAGLTELPCTVADMTRQEQVSTMLVENMQRNDLTMYEQAYGFQMMIDFGDSIETIAEKSGFSKSTVSKRLKLTSLDKTEFKAAEARGATLDDFLRATEITDEKKRKEVLTKAGTNNFESCLAGALKEQKKKQLLPQIKAELKEFAEPGKEGDRWSSKFDTVKRLDIVDYKPGCLTPDDAGKTKYWYEFSYDWVYVLKKKEKTKAAPRKVSAKEKKANELRQQLEAVSKKAYELRRTFVQQFTAAQKYRDVILTYLVRFLIKSKLDTSDMRSGGFDRGLVRDTIGQGGARWEIEEDKLKAYHEKNPSNTLLLFVYAYLTDSENTNYYSSSWGENMPQHEECEQLDFIYELLCAIGYQMSDEEKQLQDGTHPLFKKEG